MQKKILSLTIVLCMVVTNLFSTVVFAVDDVTQPTVTGVYIDGEPILGNTLTLHYTVNNPDGSLDNLANSVKWVKQGSKQYLKNDDNNNASASGNLLQNGGMSLTIPNDNSLVGKYIAVQIPVDSITGNGSMRTMGIGPIATRKTDEMITSSVTIVSANANGVGGNCGDKLSGKFIAPDGEYECRWYMSDSEDGTYQPIVGATTGEYVIADELYGKYIKFGVTPKNKDTLMSDNTVLVGNAGFGAFVYGAAGSRCYSGCALNALTNGIISNDGGGLYTYADTSGTMNENSYAILDLGNPVKISQIALRISGTADDYFYTECSTTGESGTWTPMIPLECKTGTSNSVAINGIGISYANFATPYTARYVKVWFTHFKNTYFTEIMAISVQDAAPAITLNGNDNINILLGQDYEEPGYSAYDDEDGDLTDNVTVTGSVDTGTAGTYTLTYSVTDFAVHPHTVTATRTVNVASGFQKNGDMAYGSDVTISAGENPSSLVDGNEYTSWNLESGESNAVIDLGEEKLVSRIEIEETGENIADFKLYGSGNGTSYSLIASGDGLGSFNKDIDVYKIRYLKLVVNSNGTNGKINSFCCYFDDLGKAKYAADKIDIDADLDSVTEDLPLPTSGEFDTIIEWSSSNTSVITDNGAVKRGTENKKAVLTATVSRGEHSITREFEITVAKKRKTSSGGGGSSSSVTVPYTPIVIERPVVQPETQEKSLFSDLTEEHWAYEYIEFLYDLELVSGYDDGTFGANQIITRAQFLKMVLDALDLSAEGNTVFTDINKDDWYYLYVVSAVKLGIVKGMGDGTFGADLPISRQDMAVIAAKALNCAKLLPEYAPTDAFTDYAEISGYAVDSVGRMNNAKIICGDTTGAFRPLAAATRAEGAKIAALLYKLKGGI